MSNGGGFTNTLACSPTPGIHFAAFAPVSGAFYDDLLPPATTTCNPAFSPLPMLEFHGQADKTIPYFGGRSAHGDVPSVVGWMERWARRDGCGEPVSRFEKEEGFEEGGYKRESWSCGGVEGVVQHYNISKLGHRWPTMKNSPVDASGRIIEFFNRHHK